MYLLGSTGPIVPYLPPFSDDIFIDKIVSRLIQLPKYFEVALFCDLHK
jgi:hypothetical protein